MESFVKLFKHIRKVLGKRGIEKKEKTFILSSLLFFFYNKKKSSVNFDAIIIYSFRFENDFSASGKPTLTCRVEIRNIVPYLQLFFFLFKIIYFYYVFL